MAWGAPSAIGAKGEANNANMTPGLPTYSAGDILFIAAYSRYAVGGPATFTASGYTVLDEQYGVTLLAKKAGASESAPTVVPSGGVTGGTCVCFMWSMAGGDADNLGSIVVTSADNQDGSADTNIETAAITPGEANTAVIAVGGARDNDVAGTGVTAPSWGTLIGYADSTLGADALVCAAYQIQTSVSALGTDAFAVSPSALTESIIVALRAAAAASVPKARILTLGVG